jgi:surfeit locus 1 family protein
MNRGLLAPRWLGAHLLVLVLFVTFVNLGLWQMRRLEERQLENVVGASRAAAPALPLDLALDAAGVLPESLDGRPVSAVGEYDRSGEVLIRGQVEAGQAGYHVITPLRLDNGEMVLVNRGWVPLDMDEVPVLAAPPTGNVEIDGIVAIDEARVGVPPGKHPIYNRVDIGASGGGASWPIYLKLSAERSSRLPIPLPPPDFTSDGNHLSYAVQWFSFALIGAIGYFFLLRRARQSSNDLGIGGPPEDVGIDPDLGGSGPSSDDDPSRLHDSLIDPDRQRVR